VGDLNGIGIELILKNHHLVTKMVEPIYMIDEVMLNRASQLLNISIPSNFNIVDRVVKPFEIEAGKISKGSGVYSFGSFLKGVEMARAFDVDGLFTMPIHKKAWELAGVRYRGHTEALRGIFFKDAIMMLGVPQMFVALYTEHIPLQGVSKRVRDVERLTNFLIDFYYSIELEEGESVALLGLNPHAGDSGVLGDDEKYILEARELAHRAIGRAIYTPPLVPDTAFTPNIRKRYRYFVAMYHDQGLAPLKALHFDESINISLNLPILRVSVDHGTAFDIAYRGGRELNSLSYLNGIRYLA